MSAEGPTFGREAAAVGSTRPRAVGGRLRAAGWTATAVAAWLGVALLSTSPPVLPGGRAAAQASESPESPAGQVNINTASPEELQRLPGVGPNRAEAIVQARERRPFRQTYEIMRVRGIGRASFRRLRPMLTIQGPTTLGVDGAP